MSRFSRTTLLLLPVIQMGLAAVLILHNFWKPLPASIERWEEPDRQICDAINAPAAVARWAVISAAERLAPNYAGVEFFFETVIYLVLVGFFWYLVGVEVCARLRKGLASRSGLRALADLFGFLIGSAVIATGFVVRQQFVGVTLYSSLLALMYFLWGAGIVIFYGAGLLAWRSNLRQPPSVNGTGTKRN